MQRAGHTLSSRHARPAQRGVALVITIIMLSIITVMTVAFLALARRDKAAVAGSLAAIDAEYAATTASERAKTYILAQILVRTNLTAPDFAVSVNVDTGITGGRDPRPPVFVRTNFVITPRPLDDERFFHDVNQNRFFDPSGTNINGVFQYGDPQWIGILEKPGLEHSRSNRYIGRYCYVIVPVGKQLDLNFIHNVASPVEGFLRNQGFGGWENNLASFLVDLNTNYWGNYAYGPSTAPTSGGDAFNDAAALTYYRYNGRFLGNPKLQTVSGFNSIFGPANSAAAASAFSSDFIDGYLNSPPFLFNPPLPDTDINPLNDPNHPWVGTDNPRRFFDLPRLFELSKSETNPIVAPGLANFVKSLRAASASADPYNAGTFYRLISQLGTDSVPEKGDKIHLNYANVNGFDATNFVSWDDPKFTVGRVSFFTNVVARLLRETPGIVTTNFPIQIYPTNYYTPGLHRLLQVAANIYDATTTNQWPTVFKPVFSNGGAGGQIYIAGYEEKTDTNLSTNNWRDLNDPTERAAVQPTSFVYGIPLVIGAKRGYPNFNELALQTTAFAQRKLFVSKPDRNSKVNATNQMYHLGVSNSVVIEAWNSYTNPFPRPLQVFAYVATTTTVHSDAPTPDIVTVTTNIPLTTIPANAWLGSSATTNNFILPLASHRVILPDSAYKFSPSPQFYAPNSFHESGIGLPVPNWTVSVTNRVLFFLIDGTHIVDSVGWSGIGHSVNVTEEIAKDPVGAGLNLLNLWDTNRLGTSVFSPTVGIRNQMRLSTDRNLTYQADWANLVQSVALAADSITNLDFFIKNPTPGESLLEKEVGYTVGRVLVRTSSWQVNDPLVHYMPEDTQDGVPKTKLDSARPKDRLSVTTRTLNKEFASIGAMNLRYKPWGGFRKKATEPPAMADDGSDPNLFLRSVKDPFVQKSDDWDFPASKFPSIGWLGRVHRGTPWQTIYLKSDVAPAANWLQQHSTMLSHPTNDWHLVDMFTVAPHPNATRGQLSINQPGLAAWSAVFGGVLVLANNSLDDSSLQPPPNAGDAYSPPLPADLYKGNTQPLIQPNSPELFKLVNAINARRGTRPNRLFSNVSDLLAIPELTVNSPFLNLSDAQQKYGLTDAAYERIPQQILSLLKVGDSRFVIYAWGQSLKPAPNSIVTAANPPAPLSFGLCTNYQITAEVATRTVMRIDNLATNSVSTNGVRLALRPVVESFNLMPPD
jgi:hypothetical protein